ncbi:MAG TPA: serine hydrolase [Candidatus Saccharimonadia bacterium]|jgi:D-alanyl-D-alanine carboxypeptidase
MKALALIFTLLLHVTGLWGHLPNTTRAQLTAADIHVPGVIKTAGIPIALTPPGPLPIQTGTDTLSLNVAAAVAVDASTGTVLYSNNAGAKRPIASITKLITTMVILSGHQPSEPVTVPKLPTYDPADELVGLKPGETYSVGDLVTAALVQSGDDAADALAFWDSGTSTKFAAKMNSKMAEWGISDTHFSSPSGLQDQNNYSTAASVSKIALLALSSTFIRHAVTLQNTTITSTAGRTLSIQTIDQLLATGQFYGIKTGYTPAAGECFVGLTRINGHEVVTVVLGADDRFAATQRLTNWISGNWQWL